MYAIIVDGRLVVVYPSVNVMAEDDPIVRSTGEGVGSFSEETDA